MLKYNLFFNTCTYRFFSQSKWNSEKFQLKLKKKFQGELPLGGKRRHSGVKDINQYKNSGTLVFNKIWNIIGQEKILLNEENFNIIYDKNGLLNYISLKRKFTIQDLEFRTLIEPNEIPFVEFILDFFNNFKFRFDENNKVILTLLFKNECKIERFKNKIHLNGKYFYLHNTTSIYDIKVTDDSKEPREVLKVLINDGKFMLQSIEFVKDVDIITENIFSKAYIIENDKYISFNLNNVLVSNYLHRRYYKLSIYYSKKKKVFTMYIFKKFTSSLFDFQFRRKFYPYLKPQNHFLQVVDSGYQKL